MRKSVKIAAFLLVAAAHFALSLGLFFSSFASTMDRLDSGAPATLSEGVVAFISDALFFPLVTLAGLSFVLNSLLWGAVIRWLAGRIIRRASGREVA